MSDYSDSEIQVLEGLDAVRVRPKLWVGSTDSRGLHQLVWELVYNCLDEYNAGDCHRIAVTLNGDGTISVEDDGLGITSSVSEKTGLSGVEIVFTTLGCPTGFGAAVVNALSERLEVESYWNGKLYKKAYQRGRDLTPLEFIGDTDKHGTRVTVLPDKEIFAEVCDDKEKPVFDFEELSSRLREIAFLNNTLRIDLADVQSNKRETFHFSAGISDYLSWLNDKHARLNEVPIFLTGEREIPGGKERLNFECAIQWTDRKERLSLVFFNNDPVPEKYSIHDLNAVIGKTLNEYARANHLLDEHESDISESEISNGISTVLSTKSGLRLRSLDKEYLENIIKDVLQECFRDYLMRNNSDAMSLIQSLKKQCYSE